MGGARGGRRPALAALLLCALLLLLLARAALAAAPIVVAPDAARTPVVQLDYLEDPSGTLTAAEARASGAWRPSPRDVPSFGFTGSAFWFRFEVESASPAAWRAYLDLSQPTMDEVTLYAPTSSGEDAVTVTGDHHPFAERPLRSEDFVFPVDVLPGRHEYLLRAQSTSSLQVPLTLWSPGAFVVAERNWQIEEGLFYGALLVTLAYNLFVFFAVRDRNYLIYVIYVAAMVFWRATIDGRLFEYVWPGSPRWNEIAAGLGLGALFMGISGFTRAFLDLKKGMPRADLVIRSFAWYGAATAAAAFVVSYRLLALAECMVTTLASPFVLGVGIVAWRRGRREARFYVVAFTSFLFGASTYILAKLGIAPRTPFTETAMQFGSVLEAVLLSFALADRISILRAEKEQSQREATENLRREVERQTRELRDQAQKLQELDRQKTHFFQNVSHELRTPLTLILNPLDEMMREARLADDPRLDVALKNARRLLRLVNQLLDFQKLAAGKKELHLVPIELASFAASCGEYFAPACDAQGIAFRVRSDGDGLVVRAEVDALEKVVFNYLANALKFTPRGKSIELRTERKGVRVRLSVCDEGPGISDEGRGKLFQLFSQAETTSEHAGTGLGLALARELASAMGGEVGVESTVGSGSTFWVDLPAVTPDSADAARAREVAPAGRMMAEVMAARASVRLSASRPAATPLAPDAPLVLVVDDLGDMRDLVGRTIARHPYRVTTAASGKQALAAMRETRPDLVVTDWMMPEMSGPELVRAIRADATLASVPVVLLTAKSDEESKLEGTELGADAFLGKPFNEQELVSTVRNLVRLKEREREVERLNRHIAENVLKRYLPPPLVDDILAGRVGLDVEPETVQATVLFADLAGFTRTSALLRAAKMARLVNEYLSKMNDVVFAHGGTVDKYMGDGIMVIFGAPVRAEAKEQVMRAARCALDMQETMGELCARWTDEGLPELKLRVGVHHGPVVVGNFGDARRSDYTAIGPTVNLASRIEGAATPGEVLVSGEVYDFLPETMAEDAGAFQLKGIDGSVRCFRLVAGKRASAVRSVR